ncbi:MAG: nucleotidyltransferase domain-containing protein [Nanoarchaeota archaeon]|nr:nucleotidyltransferase domain-containing protein [Nanoarchaeota archaeon]
MLNQEHGIVGVFLTAPWKKLTFSEVKKAYGSKSKSYVYGILKKLVSQGILCEEKAGNVLLYSLNLGSLKAQVYAGMAAEHKAWSNKHIPCNDLEKLKNKIHTPFYILIITGSYAKGRQKRDSDIDVVIICDDKAEPKMFYAELRHLCEMNIPEIHLYTFKKTEFLAMLLDSKANYGKETAKNCLVFAGGREYYAIINEAVRNGLNDTRLS